MEVGVATAVLAVIRLLQRWSEECAENSRTVYSAELVQFLRQVRLQRPDFNAQTVGSVNAARKALHAGLPAEPLYGMVAEAGLGKGFVYADGRLPRSASLSESTLVRTS